MRFRTVMTYFLVLVCITGLKSQLKYVVEDFEGFVEGSKDLKKNGVFTFGNINGVIERKSEVSHAYSGEGKIQLKREGKLKYGGWGIGVTSFIELDPMHDFLNFYIYQPSTNANSAVKIEIQDDDNEDGIYESYSDDSWIYYLSVTNKNNWMLYSIPLSKFKDGNKGGDGLFNINYRDGKLLGLVFTFVDSTFGVSDRKTWSFDFICFSKGILPTGKNLFDPLPASPKDFCTLGAWSKEGNGADYTAIAKDFENLFTASSQKKLGVIHFFQPFAADGGNAENLYPSVEKINEILQEGYLPMVTLEDHFVNVNPGVKQPNLYSILEGHFDVFFANWARQIKQVKGIVLLRILHEFNGNWYPWCIVNNDKNAQLFIKAFRKIHDIFKAEQVSNVRFIWCPNSLSFPREKWNCITEAYPGDEYVDIVGMDIYNGANNNLPVWRSFRQEGIENYFILTQKMAGKPLVVCETASRERNQSEGTAVQNKAGWIKQMGESLGSDMSKIRLLTWFNEKKSFQINSSAGAEDAFLKYILQNDYFRSGTKYIYPVINK